MAQKFTEVSEFVSGQPGHTAKLNVLVEAIRELQVAFAHTGEQLAAAAPVVKKAATRTAAAKAPAKAE